jgi:hypothetical protein
MNLFVEMDENSDLISGIATEDEIDEDIPRKTRFDFEEEEE